MSNNSSIETYSKDFVKVNHELKAYWEMGREAARNVGIKINELVSILYKEHKDWNVKKIAYTIAAANDGLEGFSFQTIYAHLNDDHKALLDPSKQNRHKNNVIEESDSIWNHNVTEDSSSPTTTTTRTLPTAYEVKEAETVTADLTYDIDQDEDDEEESSIQFKAKIEDIDTFWEMLQNKQLSEGQDVPVIVTYSPNNATGIVELDVKGLRSLRNRK